MTMKTKTDWCGLCKKCQCSQKNITENNSVEPQKQKDKQQKD